MPHENVFFLTGLIVFTAYMIFSVYAKEAAIKEATPLVLELRPVDPRSLLQGDYMIIALELETDIELSLQANQISNSVLSGNKGYAKLRLSSDGFHEFDQLVESAGPMVVAYRVIDNTVQVGSGTFFFEEGQASNYARASYARMLLLPDQSVLIDSLLDSKQQTILPEHIVK